MTVTQSGQPIINAQDFINSDNTVDSNKVFLKLEAGQLKAEKMEGKGWLERQKMRTHSGKYKLSKIIEAAAMIDINDKSTCEAMKKLLNKAITFNENKMNKWLPFRRLIHDSHLRALSKKISQFEQSEKSFFLLPKDRATYSKSLDDIKSRASSSEDQADLKKLHAELGEKYAVIPDSHRLEFRHQMEGIRSFIASKLKSLPTKIAEPAPKEVPPVKVKATATGKISTGTTTEESRIVFTRAVKAPVEPVKAPVESVKALDFHSLVLAPGTTIDEIKTAFEKLSPENRTKEVVSLINDDKSAACETKITALLNALTEDELKDVYISITNNSPINSLERLFKALKDSPGKLKSLIGTDPQKMIEKACSYAYTGSDLHARGRCFESIQEILQKVGYDLKSVWKNILETTPQVLGNIADRKECLDFLFKTVDFDKVKWKEILNANASASFFPQPFQAASKNPAAFKALIDKLKACDMAKEDWKSLLVRKGDRHCNLHQVSDRPSEVVALCLTLISENLSPEEIKKTMQTQSPLSRAICNLAKNMPINVSNPEKLKDMIQTITLISDFIEKNCTFNKDEKTELLSHQFTASSDVPPMVYDLITEGASSPTLLNYIIALEKAIATEASLKTIAEPIRSQLTGVLEKIKKLGAD